jgi:Protein of unknown function (DUF4012)
LSSPPENPDATDDAPTPIVRRVRRRRSLPVRRPWRRRHRRGLITSGVVGVVVLGFVIWLAVAASSANSNLNAARGDAQAARAELLSGNTAAVDRSVNSASNHARDAHNATASLPWRLMARIPYVGQPFRATQELTAAVVELTTRVLVPAAKAGVGLSPEKLRPSGKQIDLAALTAARIPLAQAAASAKDVMATVDAIAPAGYLSSVDNARQTLRQQTAELSDLLNRMQTAATLLPSMLGGQSARRYFVGFQTNAEARGTGGLLGAYGLLEADQGNINFDTLSSNKELSYMGAPLDLGPDFTKLYSNYNSTTSWVNSNISPNFPYTGQIWQSLWQQQSGQKVDGAIATDPVALSYLLDAVGPITLKGGEVVNKDNVVRLSESEAYLRFADDNKARKAYLQEIASSVVSKVFAGGGGSTVKLLEALGRAAGEGRLAVWSDVPGEEQLLAGTPLGRTVPATAAPYANLVVNNAAGNKLDYYLSRKLSYVAESCTGPTRISTVRVTLTNEAPTSGLPRYVNGRVDEDPQGPPGTSRSLMSLYATSGAQLRSVSIDGVPTTVEVGSELGHPVYTANLQIPPGTTRVLTYQLIEPTAPGVATVPVQPLVLPMGVSVEVPDCTK